MSSDYPLEPTDPLTFLLNPDTVMDDDDQAADWSQFTNILSMPDDNLKLSSDTMQSMPDNFLSMDFNPALGLDPEQLRYNFPTSGDMFGSATDSFSQFETPNFPFTFQNEFTMPRRLSITSSSSSSGGSSSLSPVMQSVAASPADSSSASSYTPDAADELAERVRQSAGVMLAVLQQHQQYTGNNQSLDNVNLSSLQFQQPTAVSLAPTAHKAHPSASTTNTIKPSPSSTPLPPEPVATTSTRPRTSHTTIERRYRTNLNTRIQSLRNVVPALRVLDKKKPYPEDIVDERGFVDGVKVARKCSKANVLGKAEEYIRVLKKREQRLLTEQNGLRTLICGLVGGPALLREWEREWRQKFGGQEKDEIENGGANADESDDDDGDGDGDEDEALDEGRKRKKPKVAPANAKEVKLAPTANRVVPEKRKRGRPRKVIPDAQPIVPPPVVSSESATAYQPQQYLLAVFALFSFFNSSSSPFSSFSSSHEHSHTGIVLTSSSSPPLHGSNMWGPLIQYFHLLVSALVFISIIAPWILPSKLSEGRLRKLLAPFIPSRMPIGLNKSRPSPLRSHRTALLCALAPARRGSPDEVEELRSILGAGTGFGLLWHWFGAKESSFEGRGLEQRAWVRLGEIASLQPSTSTLTRLQTYWNMSKLVPQFGASVSDMVTLALVLYSIAPNRAKGIWDRAKYKARVASVKACERLVVESLSIEDATKNLSTGLDDISKSPVVVLAEQLVHARLLRESKALFIDLVLDDTDVGERGGERAKQTKERRRKTVEAAKSLGGRMADMGDLLERISGECPTSLTTSFNGNTNSDIMLLQHASDGPVEALLVTLMFYKQVFPTIGGVSIVLEDKRAQLALRRVLGEEVFEMSSKDDGDDDVGDLEDARDRAVDMLVECERKGRW